MQAAFARHSIDAGVLAAIGTYVQSRLSPANAARLLLAAVAVVAIPIDFNHRVLSPAPNWPLVAIEPVALLAFLRCMLGSISRT